MEIVPRDQEFREHVIRKLKEVLEDAEKGKIAVVHIAAFYTPDGTEEGEELRLVSSNHDGVTEQIGALMRLAMNLHRET